MQEINASAELADTIEEGIPVNDMLDSLATYTVKGGETLNEGTNTAKIV